MKFIIEHLSKQFGPKEVLRDINFTFEAGRIYGLLGRNGAGKTTLFNCLNRDIKADGGSFWLEEQGQRRDCLLYTSSPWRIRAELSFLLYCEQTVYANANPLSTHNQTVLVACFSAKTLV